jgi:3-hydroxyisobutyrate dehydrogenase-like beta-hydroxyacid dehydrogenase
MTETVGFVGIGNQGGPMAERILRGGFPLTVWARRPGSAAPFEHAGARVAHGLRDLGAGCSLVGVCVTTDDDVRHVVLGADGLLAAMAPGTSLAIHSTVHPDTVRGVYEAGAERDVAVIDAPVSGGSAASVAVLGDAGAGQLAKLVNNALSAANFGAALQALAASGALGLDRTAMQDVLAASSGGSFMLRRAFGMEPEGAALAAAAAQGPRAVRRCRLVRRARGAGAGGRGGGRGRLSRGSCHSAGGGLVPGHPDMKRRVRF